MPPNSFAEWMIGCNAVSKTKRPVGPRRVIKLDWSTDDESESDIVKITVPRQTAATAKKVRFRNGTKSAMKESSEDTSSKSESEVSTTRDSTTTDDETSEYDVDSDCPCGPCLSARRKLKRSKQAKKKAGSSGEDSGSDAEVHAKHKSQKAQKANGKHKSNGQGEEFEKSENDSNGKASKGKGKQESNAKQGKDKNGKGQKGDDSKSGNENSSKKGKGDQSNNEKGGNGGKKGKKATADEAEDESDSDASTTAPKKGKQKQKQKQKADVPPYKPPPEIRKPNLLMPIRSQILQVEHTVETVEDPRPNAFYDNEHGVMRVYHGPSYGNPYEALYPKRSYDKRTLPLGTPHPTRNPWYNGFPKGKEGSSRGMAPAAPVEESQNPWFQGYGTTTGGDAPGDTRVMEPEHSTNPFKRSYGANHPPATDFMDYSKPIDLGDPVKFRDPRVDMRGGWQSSNASYPPDTPAVNNIDRVESSKNIGFGSSRRADSDSMWYGRVANGKDGSPPRQAARKPYTEEDSKKVDELLARLRANSKDSKNDSTGHKKVDEHKNTSGNNGTWEGSNQQNANTSGNNNKNNNNDDNWNNNNDDNWNNTGNHNGQGDNTNNNDNQTDNSWANNTNNIDNQNPSGHDGNNSNDWPANNQGENSSWNGASNDNNNYQSPNSMGWGDNGSNRSHQSTANNVGPLPGSYPSDDNGLGNPDGAWSDPSAAQSSGGYWDKEGKGTEKTVNW